MKFPKLKALGLGIGLFVVVYVPAFTTIALVRPHVEIAVPCYHRDHSFGRVTPNVPARAVASGPQRVRVPHSTVELRGERDRLRAYYRSRRHLPESFISVETAV